ncbi:hypothetical protein FT663_01818 [Candidozyma haemuli var. vulneris]|uniref:Uncharacterized protein n=1 Tax=Candidozyma haemuli TaxID=45357 RepID=A0A2V1B016_9ASCO|nr:hypothetical protein CXQ85_002843 [[Candida] haemuloni]KAF3991060.1 hypothetical protein FT662_01888 [[Candida] haemuloni var. vulneris]KAF3993650.1 hypothetical protein FT663_01818 [[Candida] haemuloni var. vulneris]PVH23116.1 hypothetical protein CXQ85_002843 [[Candida] haemuloni]
MSVNKVQYNGDTPALQPGEIIRFNTRSTRQPLAINSQSKNVPLKIHINASEGKVFVTNQRLVYLTSTNTSRGDIESFCINFNQLPKLKFTHALKSALFGANYWEFMFYSPSEGICDGFPREEYFQGSITFKDGGMFDFGAAINEAINDVVNNPHIDDELPRYSEL